MVFEVEINIPDRLSLVEGDENKCSLMSSRFSETMGGENEVYL